MGGANEKAVSFNVQLFLSSFRSSRVSVPMPVLHAASLRLGWAPVASLPPGLLLLGSWKLHVNGPVLPARATPALPRVPPAQAFLVPGFPGKPAFLRVRRGLCFVRCQCPTCLFLV